MKELDLQGGWLLDFLCNRTDGLQYTEVKANTVNSKTHIIEDDLQQFLSQTTFNKSNYAKLKRKYNGNEEQLMHEVIEFLLDRVRSAANIAVFFNLNKRFTFQGIDFTLFAPSGSELVKDEEFDQNIFSVVQELSFDNKLQASDSHFSFRPDLSFFLNGFFFGYSELKSNWNNQDAKSNGRKKIINDYFCAATDYLRLANGNDESRTLRRQLLFPFEKSIHITSTDISSTFVLRNPAPFLDDIRSAQAASPIAPDYSEYNKNILRFFKPYPLRNKKGTMTERFEEVFHALYDKKMIEKEILYYNFLERELVKDRKGEKQYKHNDGRLIAPRPKQKFGTDKIIVKIPEFLQHEGESEYFANKLREELISKGASPQRAEELVQQRLKFQNNKNVYSLLLQYAAGFGKSNIIGWTALQLKDLRDAEHRFVYDKIMIVVDRLQLRDQLDTMLHNMNIQKGMFTEVTDKKTFKEALTGNKRIAVINIQKFGATTSEQDATTAQFLDAEALNKLASLRVCFIIDEIHRSNNGSQHEEMISLFDEMQAAFDNNDAYKKTRKKKNLIIGFTATPSDVTLARFGEFSHFAENRPIWVPFDYYTMQEAIADGFILNPIKGIVPVAAKMYFAPPKDELEGFEGATGYDEDDEEYEKHYAIRKEKIYSDKKRIEAISKFVVDRLLSAIYPNIRGEAKAMLAVSSIPNAIAYRNFIAEYYPKAVAANKKYERFSDAPISIVYSDRQDVVSSASLNNNIGEEKVLQNFRLAKNGLIIVVDKLQTGFDEPKLHTLFLDKEIRGINAIQTISRVNRTCKYKNDCKIIDFSHLNVNVANIKKAFEHFGCMVVSDFNPLEDEKKIDTIFKALNKHDLFKTHFDGFKKVFLNNKNDSVEIIAIQEAFEYYINEMPKEADLLKEKVCAYFRILNLIEFVLELDKKYSNEIFLDFWHKFNNIYNKQRPSTSTDTDDVEIYFDNKIGILEPVEDEGEGEGDGPKEKTGNKQGKKYKYNILAEIERRNEKEAEIEKLIQEFEKQVDALFEYIRNSDGGKRLIAKIRKTDVTFPESERKGDFKKLYNSYVLKNKLSEFFKKETKDSLDTLYSDFENSVYQSNY